MKRIKHHTEIKGGTWYIRLYVNCFGDCKVEVLKIVGKPKTLRKHIHGRFVSVGAKIETRTKHGSSMYYLSDLFQTSTLVPFSHKLLLKVNNLINEHGVDNNRHFYNLINNTHISDNECGQKLWEFELEEWRTSRYHD